MNWLQKISTTAFEDMFGDFLKNRPNKVSEDQPTVENVTLQLWRGFNADFDKMKKSGNGYIMSPHKSEQGVMWFTHNLINGYNPREYVSGRGQYLLQYPLNCKRHFQRVHYDNGSHYDRIPEETLGIPTENSKFYQGYELSDGWFFSYKMEKFIVCSIPIKVTPEMITLND